MLNALAGFEALGVTVVAKSHVAVFSDQSSRSSGFRANLSALSASGLIERVGGDAVRLTDAGREVASPAEAPVTLKELHQAWSDKLSTPQATMLALLIQRRKAGWDKDELAVESGQSPLSSGFRANLSNLSALGLLDRRDSRVYASDLLFPEGLD